MIFERTTKHIPYMNHILSTSGRVYMDPLGMGLVPHLDGRLVVGPQLALAFGDERGLRRRSGRLGIQGGAQQAQHPLPKHTSTQKQDVFPKPLF